MRPRIVPKILLLAGWLAPLAPADVPRPDVVVADFEGAAYGPGWQVTGSAFGPGPAPGALPGQMSVAGFDGRGLVNSFAGGDDAEGTLTSPPFPIERRYLNFLIGGGKYPGQTCVDLVIAGKTVRTATGPNDAPGGSERLAWATWDVAEFAGLIATLRVVDARKGGWGHINLDQVTQSDTRRQEEPATRTIVADRRYLHLPVDPQGPIRRVQITNQAGQVVREFDIRLGNLADRVVPVDVDAVLAFGKSLSPKTLILTWAAFSFGPAGKVLLPAPDAKPIRDENGLIDLVAFLDLAPLRGQTLVVSTPLPPDSKLLDSLTLSDQLPDQDKMYAERDRPRFHFTSRRGWLNDPNGLVWHEGIYHLFYQHNPYGWDWGNMHWGHATSPDLVHWTEQPIALYPHQYGDWAFSGSAVVDTKNTSGWGADGKAPLVAAYTSTGRGECIVFSNDAGQTWTEFAGNPVVRHNGRDPRLFWHEPTRRWIMAVYEEGDGNARQIAFHSSPDLKAWTEESRIDGFYECPDLFELPVTGANPPRSLWVLSAADGQYRLGQFDGHKFTPETEKLTLWHGEFYAAQTFSNTPDGRRIQIGWGRDITFPGMPFNQQMTIPCELTLRTTPAGPRLFAEPVAELAKLRPREHGGNGLGLAPLADHPLDQGVVTATGLAGQAAALDIEVTIWGDAPGGWSASIFGNNVSYNEDRQTINVAGLTVPLPIVDGKVTLRILADRRSLEVFGNGGQVAISRRIVPKPTLWPIEHTFWRHPQRDRQYNYNDYGLRSAW